MCCPRVLSTESASSWDDDLAFLFSYSMRRTIRYSANGASVLLDGCYKLSDS
jgi:hypothetical protein